MRSDKECDLECNLIPCNLDYSGQIKKPYLTYFEVSDCIYDCLFSCDHDLLENGVCDEQCNNSKCAFDLGDCGFCNSGCTQAMLTNGICDSACEVAACDYDANDCVKTNAGL